MSRACSGSGAIIREVNEGTALRTAECQELLILLLDGFLPKDNDALSSAVRLGLKSEGPVCRGQRASATRGMDKIYAS
jgi:alanine racemase